MSTDDLLLFPEDGGDIFGPSRPTYRQTPPHSGIGAGLLQRHASGARLFMNLHDKNNAQCREILECPQKWASVKKCRSCVYMSMHTRDIDENDIHELWLQVGTHPSGTFFSETGLTDFVNKRRSLVDLHLSFPFRTEPVNGGSPASQATFQEDVAQFARAIGASNVRSLSFSNLNAAGARAFLDNLPPSHIHHLSISIDELEQFDHEKDAAFVDSLARFLTDPVRSRSVKEISFDPLSDEGNYLLKHIILGSYAAVDVTSPEILLAQKPNLSVMSTIGYSQVSNHLISFPAWMRHSRYSLENRPWKAIGNRNVNLCRRTQQEAHDLLRIARIVGCRAQFLGHEPGVIPFFKFPGELRLWILSMLAPHLDGNQVMSVLSWACCAETIGHCCKRRVDTRPPMEPTLDVPPWDWDNCCTNGSHGTLTYTEISSYSWPGSVQRQKHIIPFVESTGTNVPSLAGWYGHLLQNCGACTDQ